MDAIASTSALATGVAKSLGHIALHTPPGTGALAARLFELMECRVRKYPVANDESFYIVSVNDRDPEAADNVIFISPVTPEQHALEQEIIRCLGIGTEKVSSVFQDFAAMKERKPELYLHFGIHFRSLEVLEETIQRIEAEVERDPSFGRHVQGIQKLRAKKGNTAIDARMESSPVFADTDLQCYGTNIVQGHVRTTLFSTGLGFTGSVLELDYVFTGEGLDKNPFNSL